MTIQDLHLGSRIRFTKLFGDMYAATGETYEITAIDTKYVSWNRVTPSGMLGSGSFARTSTVARAEFEAA